MTASSYGNQVSYLPENRPYMAVDGNPDTSWETGTFVPDPTGQWWQLSLQHPTTAGEVRLVQPLKGDPTRYITKVTLDLRRRPPRHGEPRAALAHRLRPGGQLLVPQSSGRCGSRIDAVSNEHPPLASPRDPSGSRAWRSPGSRSTRSSRCRPTCWTTAGTASLHNRLTMVMTRQRVSPYPARDDPETTISREFDLPTARTFTLSGTASLSALVPDDAIDRAGGPARR